MKKLILLFFVLGGIILSQAYTSSYKCIDRKDKYVLWINIDQNSLHFRDSNKSFLFNYDKTVPAKDKDNVLIHIFSANNYEQLTYQSKTNPFEVYIDDYKDNKLRYEYKCKLKYVLEDENGIPITWRSIEDKEKILEEIAKPVPKSKIVIVKKTASISKVANDNIEKQKFYEENLDMYAFCAANYFVRTSTPKNQKALSEMIQSYGMTSQYIGSLYFSKIYKKTASKGTMFEYREKHLLLLEKDFRDDRKLSKETLHKISQCDGKIVYLSNNPSVYNNIDKAFMYSKESDKLFLDELSITTQEPAKIDKKRILESFKVWVDDHNGLTPKKMLKKLKTKN
jgi:hypothetical protein